MRFPERAARDLLALARSRGARGATITTKAEAAIVQPAVAVAANDVQEEGAFALLAFHLAAVVAVPCELHLARCDSLQSRVGELELSDGALPLCPLCPCNAPDTHATAGARRRHREARG